MVKVGTLFTYPNYYRAQKALIAGALSGADFDVTLIDDASVATSSSRVPLLRIHDGAAAADDDDAESSLFDANAIAYRLSDEALRGRGVDETTEILQWIYFADQELLPPVCSWVFPLLGVMTTTTTTTTTKVKGEDNEGRVAVAKAKEDSLKVLKVLDDHLLFRTFIIGDRITLADISLFCNLSFLYKHVLSPSVRRPFTCLNRWFKTLHNHPVFRKEVGDFVWCETELKLEGGEKNQENAKPMTEKSKTNEERHRKKPPPPPPPPSAGPAAAYSNLAPPKIQGKEDLFAKLQSLSVEFVTVHHPEVFTVETMMPHLQRLPVPGKIGKNLFLKDKKKKLYLLTVAHDRAVKLDDIAKTIGAPGGLRLADESILESTLGVKQGCVTPYALINDSAGAVTLLLDAVFVPKGADADDADDAEFSYFHPLANDATTGIGKHDFMTFLDEIKHVPKILDMTDH